jgi:uncharacterized oxidoreductase
LFLASAESGRHDHHRFLRYGEARGDYDQVVETLNAADPRGK